MSWAALAATARHQPLAFSVAMQTWGLTKKHKNEGLQIGNLIAAQQLAYLRLASNVLLISLLRNNDLILRSGAGKREKISFV